MITLDTTTKTLEVLLGGAITTNQLPIVASYTDYNDTAGTCTPTESDTQTNGVTAVTAVAAPGAGVQRVIGYLSVYNADTAAATVTVRINDNATLRPQVQVTLQPGQSLQYTRQGGWLTPSPFPVNVSQVGGTNFALGQQLAAGSLPVVLTSAQLSTLTPLSTVAATQSGAWSASIGAALPAGTNVIGHVIVDSGTVTANQGGTWNIGTVTSITNTVTVDTELPAAAALADAASNPTAPAVGSFLVGYNGTTWDRLRSTTANGLQVDVTRVQGNVTVVGTGTFVVQAAQSGSWTVDTELPAAAALADAASNPTTPLIGSCLIGFNGTTWDRLRVDGSKNLLVAVNAALPTGSNVIGAVTQSGTWTADTELPAAAALADASGNPTAPAVGSFCLGFNGTTWDRLRVDASKNLLVAVNAALPAGTNVIGHMIVDSGTVTANQGTAAALGSAWPVKLTDGTNTAPTMDAAARAGFQKVTDGTNTAAVKAASTAAAATDPALVVAISPNNTVAVTQSGTWSLAANQSVNVAQVGGSNVATAASGTQKVGIVGNAGATVDSTVVAGTAPTNQVVVGSLYNATAPAPTTGQAMALQSDQAGNLRTMPGISLATLTGWTSATSLNSTQNIFTNSGAPAVLVQLDQTSTLTGGAITFEVTYDGSNWVTVPANAVLDPTSTSFAQISLPYTLQASTNKAFIITSSGWQGLRIKLSTAITGTATVTPYYALLPFDPVDAAIVYSPTAANFLCTASQGGTWNIGTVTTVTTVSAVTAISNALPAGTNVLGKVGIDQTTPGTTNAVQTIPGMSGGLSVNSQLSTAAVISTSVKASAGQVYGLHCFNNTGTIAYGRLYNQTSAPASTDTANIIYRFTIPANSNGAGFVVPIPDGLAFSTGIGLRVTAAVADNDTTALTANQVAVNVLYK